MALTTGDRLRFEREKRGWTQLQAAEIMGISNAALSNYERDVRQPDFEMLRRFARMYGTTTDYLLGHTRSSKSSVNQTADETDDDTVVRIPVYRPRKDTGPLVSRDNQVGILPLLFPLSSGKYFYLETTEPAVPAAAGDLLLMRRQTYLEMGALMVAETASGALLIGRFYDEKQDETYIYVPARPHDPPRVLDKGDLTVIGKALWGVVQINGQKKP